MSTSFDDYTYGTRDSASQQNICRIHRTWNHHPLSAIVWSTTLKWYVTKKFERMSDKNTYLMWFVTYESFANDFEQIWQDKLVDFPHRLSLWTFNDFLLMNCSEHNSHLKGVSGNWINSILRDTSIGWNIPFLPPVCNRIWFIKCCFWVNSFAHWKHLSFDSSDVIQD